jgi:hypothetical protein
MPWLMLLKKKTLGMTDGGQKEREKGGILPPKKIDTAD